MENINTQNGVILFTDLKDFTLKTSLLTQKQIDNILDDQDKLMLLNLKKYSGIIIKTIGDSYMIFFDTPKNSLLFAIEIQKLLKEYNKDKRISLHKIEIRISINYGILNKKNTLNGHDFFGDSVNLASRVLSRTLENKIFITDKLYDSLINEGVNCRYDFLGKTTFKGILYEVGIYEAIYEEESMKLYDRGEYLRNNNSKTLEDEKTKLRCKNIDNIIFKSSAVNCAISIQPIPFIDLYSSVTIYTFMLKNIANEYKIKLSRNQINEILLTILSAIGSYIMINQTIQGISKIGLIGIAGFLFVPLNFGTTYGVGKVMNRYFYYKNNNLKLNNTEIKELFLSGKDFGVKYAKNNKKEIIKIGKKLKDDFLKFQKESKIELNKISKEVEKEIKNLKNDQKKI
ncbi:MAG: adenylate/guanylate cyclase domain-containing protein [Candidatus Gracilibacteria bacterium]|nr:adenylate/guanylate cyclase domain-containing protein [Candidatus Gracilibacteria bacterium]